MARKPAQVVFDKWDNYISHSENKPIFISFDVDAAEQDLTGTLTHCARVMIPIHRPNKNGGPVAPESDLLYQLEDELCAGLVKHRVACRLVGRLTFDGIRQLVFQLDDWEAFRPPVGLWLMAHEEYAIDVSEEEGWDFFNDCIRPTPDVWLYLADQSVIQGLLDAGSNPEKEHALEFVFLGTEPALRQVARALQARGYRHLGPADFAKEQIVMVKKMLLDREAVFAESQSNSELAGEHSVSYDGWGAAVVH
jgi:regulator of RNase E activity RraB